MDNSDKIRKKKLCPLVLFCLSASFKANFKQQEFCTLHENLYVNLLTNSLN